MKTKMLTANQVKQILSELTFNTSRSGGKGGQHVNKLETKVTITFNVAESKAFGPEEKAIITNNIRSPYKKGIIQITSQKFRTQLQNKEDAKNKLLKLLNSLLVVPKKRKVTKPGPAALQNKKKDKQALKLKKENRKKPEF